eukprot:TRINITY_DN50057_c0_g1_i1.p2 TRINITY_DN50057_c0_g1~~TRINITY_DN50057_c0_g1_i1.p2  ORF type:complete len:123 (-),score=17.12 TRINITY_DN50057_c0_g1_i1:456-824(-)
MAELEDTFVARVAAGANHTMCLSDDGRLYCWGHNINGQIGVDGVANRHVPVEVTTPEGVVQADGGGYHSLCLNEDGELFGWGGNQYCQVQPEGGEQVIPFGPIVVPRPPSNHPSTRARSAAA